MKTYASSNSAEAIGRRLGQVWRNIARREFGAVRWMTAHGMPPLLAQSLLWAVKIVLVATLVYVALWLALLVAVVLIAGGLAKHANNRQQPEWPITEHTDHRKNSFYDPIAYCDDPDPWFDDK